jgi:hypothetical protein
VRAEAAHQALREHGHDRRGDVVALHSHLHEARDGARGVVGVQRGEHEVTRERRVHRDLGGLLVADLTHHDDVGVLAQEAAQGRREREPDLGLHVQLPDAGELVLDRVLGREDVHVRLVDHVEARVERGGLTRARGARDQHDAVRPVHQRLQGIQLALREPEVREVQHDVLLVEETHGDPLALGGGDGGDAHVHHLAGDLLRDAPVLRQALLGDVQAGFDLHARHDGREEAAVGLFPGHQLAVDAVAHHHLVVGGFDVNVGRALAHGREEEVVHPADDRRLVGHVDDVQQLLGVAVLLRLGQRSLVAAVVDAVDGVVDGHGRHGDGLHPPAQQCPQVVERGGIHGVRHGHLHAAAALAHGHHPVLTGKPDGHQRREIFRHVAHRDLALERHAHLVGQRLHQHLFFHGLRREQQLLERHVALLGLDQRLREEGLAERASAHEDLTQKTL